MESQKKTKDIVVRIAKNYDSIDVNLIRLKKLVKTVCERFTDYQIPDTSCEISIAIVNNTQIRKLNKQFLNRNSSTDCLSFDLSDDENRKLFEVVVNGERAAKEAKKRCHSSETELALYITHGLLHSLGFDDSKQNQAKKMHDTESEILQQLGYNLQTAQ
jgi:probable rRNA maturation factor